MRQLTLNLQPRVSLVAGKKLQRLTVTCSDEMKAMVEKLCDLTGETTSEFIHRHLVNGMQSDVGTVFMAEPFGEKRLSDLMVRR